MRRATLKELGIRWYYWLIPSAFGVAGGAAISAIKIEPESRTELITFGLFFCATSLLAFLWPILRTQEKQGVQYVSIRDRESHEGILIPLSKVKFRLALIGGTIFGVASLLAVIFADDIENRVNGGIAFAAYSGLAVLGLRRGLARRFGILLTEKGIFWQEPLLAPCFIPWNEISATQIYDHPEQYGRATPTFGLLVRNLESLNLNSRTKKKLIENRHRFGWHLYFHGESLLFPLELVERAVNRYVAHIDFRGELSSGAALDRINQIG